MKKISVLFITAIIAAPDITFGAISLGCTYNKMQCNSTSTYYTQTECNQNCTRGSYCCPVCYTEATGETCPDGWELTAGLPIIGGGTAGNVCSRTDNTIVAEDSNGYLKQNYGSCDPTDAAVRTQWYEISSTNKTCGGLLYCLECQKN